MFEIYPKCEAFELNKCPTYSEYSYTCAALPPEAKNIPCQYLSSTLAGAIDKVIRGETAFAFATNPLYPEYQQFFTKLKVNGPLNLRDEQSFAMKLAKRSSEHIVNRLSHLVHSVSVYSANNSLAVFFDRFWQLYNESLKIPPVIKSAYNPLALAAGQKFAAFWHRDVSLSEKDHWNINLLFFLKGEGTRYCEILEITTIKDKFNEVIRQYTYEAQVIYKNKESSNLVEDYQAAASRLSNYNMCVELGGRVYHAPNGYFSIHLGGASPVGALHISPETDDERVGFTIRHHLQSLHS